MNRREQLFLLWAVSTTVLALTLAGALFAFALPLSPARFTAGWVEDFSPGSVTRVALPLDYADPLAISNTPPQAWLVRDDAGSFTAFFARSTFHGAPVNWVPEKNHFEDVRIGSKWDKGGHYYEGPDPRDLDRFPVTVQDGQVIIVLDLIQGTSHAW